ncbi:MAG: tetratricopeptide repeat protein [Polyangiaceae bacterium]|nr:tetratricopeptide repeat protein [Polyangiaceae bacterium]
MAIEAYSEVLAAAPEHEPSLGALEVLFAEGVEQLKIAEVLEPLFQAAAEWEKLLNVREGQLAHLGELDERIALYQRMAEEAEERLADPEMAFGYLNRALAEAPENERTVDELQRLAPALDEGWERLAKSYAAVLSSDGCSAEVVAEGGRRLAEIYETELSDLQQAEATYRFILERAPGDLVALENLDRIYSSQGSWQALAGVLERRAAAVEDEFDKVELYLRLGHNYEEKLALGDLGEAVLGDEMLDRAMLDRAMTSSGAGQVAVANAPELLADSSGDDDSIDDALDLGGVEVGLDDVVEEFTEPSLDELMPASADELVEVGETEVAEAETAITPESKGEAEPEYNPERLQDAIRAYRKVFDELQPENEDAIDSLERVYALTSEWTKLDEVYKRQLDHAAGDVVEADVRAKRAHLAAERLEDVDAALEGWKRVLELRGEDPEALRALSVLYEAQERWSELTDVLERHYDIAETDEDRVHVLTSRARLFDEQLNRDDDALEQYQRVLDIDYSNATALKAIATIWRRRKNHEELVSALHQLVEQGSESFSANELAEAYRELATIYEAQDQAFEAVDAWRRLLDHHSGDFEAFDHLQSLYQKEEQWVEIVDVKMQRAAALVEKEEQIREYLEVADLWKSTIREYDKSVPAFDAILRLEPLHEQAFLELEKLHNGAERWEPLIELYLNRLEKIEDISARSDLLRRIARVFDEKLGDNDQAFEALVNAFAEDYFDDETSAYLEKIAQASNRWNELISAAQQWQQEEQDRKRKIQLSLRLGKWYGENLGHSDYAEQYYRQVLELDPRNTRVMRQMAAISRIGGDYKNAGLQLQEALKVAVANEQRVAINTDIADLLYRQMGEAEQAIVYYRRALDMNPGYLPALDSLERIYEERGQIQELVDILSRKTDSLESPQEALRQKLRLGELFETKLEDFDGATRAYQEALEADENSLLALRGLERMLTAAADWQALVKVLERQLELVDTEKERVDVLVHLARIHEEQFLKADIAAERLEEALQIDPGNEEAYVALARCYRRLKRWNDFVETARRHIDESQSRETKLDLYAAIGAVYRDEIGDLDEAVDAYQSVVDADETNVAALDALSKLFERQDDSHRAIEMMTRVADLTTDGALQVDMYYRIGRAMEEKLTDRFGAREKFEMALDLDPSHLPSLAALRTIAIDEADWDGATRYIEQEQGQTEAPRQRARLLVELGKIREDMLGEHEAAISAFEQAIQLDKDCEEAALPLVQEYSELERWADAVPLAEMLVRKSKNREKSEQHQLQKMLANVMFKLENYQGALKAYQSANQLDLTDHEAIRGVADSAFALEDWPTALSNYQRVLSALAEGEIDERAEVYYRLGAIKVAQGQDRQAINNFEKALAHDGEHRATQEALIAIYEKASDYQHVAEHKRQILDSVFDGDERFTLLSEIGDIWLSKEKDPLKAVEAYEEARDLNPQDHVLLHKMVQAYQSASEWQKMVDVLDSIMEVDQRPKLKAKLLNTQAQIYRDMLEQKERAVELFNEALDLDPEFLEAFERINKILTKDKNWKQLERSYRKMLHRIAGKGNNDLEHNLWHQLGLIYRDRMGKVTEAIEAFRMSASQKSEAPVQRKILAELYEGTEAWDDAIKEHRRMLHIDPLSAETYQALYRLYLHKQTYDQAWCVASALSFMKKADAATEQFYQDYRPTDGLQVKGRLGTDHWQRALMHPQENVHISKIFEMIAPAAHRAKVALLSSQNKLPNLPAQFLQDPRTSTVSFAQTFGWASQALGIAPPDLYVRNDVRAYLGAVVTERPTSVAGQLVISGFTPMELRFICAKHLTAYRPEHYLRVLFPTQAELTVMLFAAIHVAAPNQPMPSDQANQVQATARSLREHLDPSHLEGLTRAVKAFLEAGAKANVKRWNHAVEYTACCAGLLLSGDLQIAKKIISAEPQVPGDPPPADKLKELLVFSVSEQYFALRQALGIQIQT